MGVKSKAIVAWAVKFVQKPASVKEILNAVENVARCSQYCAGVFAGFPPDSVVRFKIVHIERFLV